MNAATMEKLQRTLLTRAYGAHVGRNPLVWHGHPVETSSRAIRCAGNREYAALLKLVEAGRVEIVKVDEYDDRTETFYKLVDRA